MFNFEKLDVWKEAVDLAGGIYDLTRLFPVEERFGLTSQLRRAAVSVSSNIAEGSSRHSKVDYARFVELAAGSLFELIFQCHIAKQQGMIDEIDLKDIYAAAEKLGKMLSGLRNYLMDPARSTHPSTINSQP